MTLLRSLAAVLPLLLLFLVPVLVPKKAQTETLLEAKRVFFGNRFGKISHLAHTWTTFEKACHASTDLYLTIHVAPIEGHLCGLSAQLGILSVFKMRGFTPQCSSRMNHWQEQDDSATHNSIFERLTQR